MDEADDFGDLYADLDPVAQEKSPSRRSPVTDEKQESVAAAASAAAAEGNGAAESSDSDSEDDLRIVLNDGDGPEFPRVQGSGDGAAAGWDDEEGDDLVLVRDADRQAAQPVDGVAAAVAEKGVVKSGYRNWHVAPQLGAFPNTARTSTYGRGDRDYPMMPCSGGSMSFKTGTPMSANFCLPRYRTIFDTDIVEFANKPWKHHGVDITDYFNFDLDEDSWKNYCRNMDICRQKATRMRFPYYESSRRNQVFETEMVATNASLSEEDRGERGEGSFIYENLDTEGGSKMPRGRAIQVGGGFGERIPTTDIIRPRLRDSDVVIQIPVEDSMKFASGLCEEELKLVEHRQIDDSVLDSDNEIHKSSSLNHHARRSEKISSPDGHHNGERGDISMEYTAEDKAKSYCSKNDVLRQAASASRLADDSASSYHILHSPRPSRLESHFVASKYGLSSEIQCSGKKTSLSSVSGLQDSPKSNHYPSNDSRSDATKQERGHSEESDPDRSLSMGDQRVRSRRRLQDEAELPTLSDSKNVFSRAHKRRHNVSYSMELSYRVRSGKHDYEFGARGHLSSYEKAEMSNSYKSKRDAEKHDGDKPYDRSFHNTDNHDISLHRDQVERMYQYKQRVPRRGSGIKYRSNFNERYHDDLVMGDIPRDSWNRPISVQKSLLRGNGSCLLQKKKRYSNENQMNPEAEYDDIVFEERYPEGYLREMQMGNIPYCDREEEVFNYKFGRHMPHTARERRVSERSYSNKSDSCFDLNRSDRYNGNCAKNRLDQRLLDYEEYSEPPIAGDRDWLDASSPTNHFPISLRSKENFVDLRRKTREMRYKNMENEGYSIPSNNHHRRSSYQHSLTFDNDGCSNEGRDIYVDNIVCNENRRFNRLAKPRNFTNRMMFRHKEWGMLSSEGPLLNDGVSRHDNSCISYHGSGRNYHDSCLYITAKKKVTEKICASSSRDRNAFVSNYYDKGRNELADIGLRKEANIRLNGWRGKFQKRSNDLDYTSKAKLYDVGSIEEGNKRQRVPPLEGKAEETFAGPTSMQASENLGIQDHLANCSTQPDNEDDEIEEGQLIEDPDDRDEVQLTKEGTEIKYVSNSVEDESRESKDPVCSNKTVGGYDSSRILETIAKMEKRRERFKEPMALKQVFEKTQIPALEVAAAAEVELVQHPRPARKRRWGGS